jgi:nicotinamide-nucleotide amidase
MKQNRRKIIFNLVKKLKEGELEVAFAESATCGMLAQMLNTVPGTSDVFAGSIVCYKESVKTSLLNIKPSLIKKHTAESQQVTDALVKNLYRLIPADICVAVTGLTTPDGSETKNKPAGTMFVSIHYKNQLKKFKKVFNGSPLEIRRKASLFVFSSIQKIISE